MLRKSVLARLIFLPCFVWRAPATRYGEQIMQIRLAKRFDPDLIVWITYPIQKQLMTR